MKISLRGRQALIVEDGAFSHKSIFLNGWNLPIGGASAVEGLQYTGVPRQVL